MKAIKLLVAVLLAGIVLASCSTDDFVTPEQPIDKGGDIEFNIGFAPQTYVATDAEFKSTWEDGDAIGIYAVSHAIGASASLVAAGNYIHNVKLTYNKTKNTWAAATPLYYKGAQMDFYAYYPHDAQATNPTAITFNVSADQSIAANYNASDLLSASTKNIAKSNNPVDLTFSHKLALVQVEVDPGTIKGSGPTETLAITLRGCKAGGAFNLGNGSLTTTGDAVAVKMLRVEKPADADYATKYTYRALVPAQSVASGTSLCLMTQNGQLFNTPKLAAALNLTAGAAKRYTAELPASALHMAKIAKGTFQMGSPDGSNGTTEEPNRRSNETQHAVTLTKDFYMSKYQITNAQYAAFLNANSIGGNGLWTSGSHPTRQLIYPSSGSYDWGLHYNTNKWESVSGYENHPIINVIWYGATEYARWIGGSLPTEAQWEYACRGAYTDKATTTATLPFGIGDGSKLDYTNANFWWKYSYELPSGEYTDNTNTYPSKTQPVGSYTANNYGLYDMHGNVFEWCSDKCDWPIADYGNTAVTDPTGSETGTSRVLRGGRWGSNALYCRSAYRNGSNPDGRYYHVGFRVVFVP